MVSSRLHGLASSRRPPGLEIEVEAQSQRAGPLIAAIFMPLSGGSAGDVWTGRETECGRPRGRGKRTLSRGRVRFSANRPENRTLG
jgi:hypothetical protein